MSKSYIISCPNCNTITKLRPIFRNEYCCEFCHKNYSEAQAAAWAIQLTTEKLLESPESLVQSVSIQCKYSQVEPESVSIRYGSITNPQSIPDLNFIYITHSITVPVEVFGHPTATLKLSRIKTRSNFLLDTPTKI